MYESENTRLDVRDPERPARVEDVAASRLPELEAFLSELGEGGEDSTVRRTLDLLPDLIVGRSSGSALVHSYHVIAPRRTGPGTFAVERRVWEDLEAAARDARSALAGYSSYIRSLAADLLKAGVDLQDLADQALAASVMEE